MTSFPMGLSANNPVPLVLVGCGAVSRLFYLPTLRELARRGIARAVAVVDPAATARNELATALDARACATLQEGCAAGARLAILATPPRFHREQAVACFAAGLDVLCEKPLATTAADAEAMVATADASGRLLAAGHYKRFMPAHRAVKHFIEHGTFGPLHSVSIAEGGKFAWPAATDSFFRREQTPGGVLLDIGVHVLDLLLWWLGSPEEFAYADDACDGLEANCRLSASFHNGTRAEVRLSRDWRTANTYVFRFASATIHSRVNASNQLELTFDGIPMTFASELREPLPSRAAAPSLPLETNAQSFIAQLVDVCRAVREQRPPVVTGASAAVAVRWIEACYARRRPLAEPWHGEPPAGGAGDQATPARPCFAIIGASGFVGLRTVEVLTARGDCSVRPVVRAASSLAVLARQRLDCRIADLLAEVPLAAALAGTEVCVHAAIGDAGQIVRMAAATYRACAAAGVRRLVWLSSASVHGQNCPPGTDESSPLHLRHPLVYNNAKVRAERRLAALARDRRVEVVVLRPGVVFGPRSRWIADAAADLLAGRAAWVDEGQGVCNSIYIDNLVEAICLAATVPAIAGEAFLVGDAETVTWADLILPIAAHLGISSRTVHSVAPPPVVPERENRLAALTTSRAYARTGALVPARAKRILKAVAAAWSPAAPRPESWQLRPTGIHPRLTTELALLQQCRWKLPHAKAARLLGYRPPVAFADGLRRSLDWLDFAGLAPARD